MHRGILSHLYLTGHFSEKKILLKEKSAIGSTLQEYMT